MRPDKVTLYEVGPRDGLQAEKEIVSAEDKIALVDLLTASGLPYIEAASFVSPKWVPQMADGAAVMKGIWREARTAYPVLTPNMQGYNAAREAGAEVVAIFGAASETFSQKNINCSIAESLARFEPVCRQARHDGIRVRGYVSTVIACPYEGPIEPQAVADVAEKMLAMGCYEISLGDTIGVGTPAEVERLLDEVTGRIKREKLAVHFHDTYGQALANILTSLEYGITIVDASVGGLGGCPYAPGASGNVATEDVLYMMNGLGIVTNVDLDEVVAAAWYISDVLGRPPRSKVANAMGRREPKQPPMPPPIRVPYI